jgi:hypothetical protein
MLFGVQLFFHHFYKNHSKMKFNSSILLFAVLFSFTACEQDDPEVPNEEELITTLTYTLVPKSGGAPVVFIFQDLDGDGGSAPIITTGNLAANTAYDGMIILLNEEETPPENISEEVAEEDDEHQFFFQTTVPGLNIAYEDADDDGNPIGLATTLTTGDAADGTMTIILRHEPDKEATGVANGSITNAGGETDIEVTFNVSVQ